MYLCDWWLSAVFFFHFPKVLYHTKVAYDPEGILGTINSIVMAFLGVQVMFVSLRCLWLLMHHKFKNCFIKITGSMSPFVWYECDIFMSVNCVKPQVAKMQDIEIIGVILRSPSHTTVFLFIWLMLVAVFLDRRWPWRSVQSVWVLVTLGGHHAT